MKKSLIIGGAMGIVVVGGLLWWSSMGGVGSLGKTSHPVAVKRTSHPHAKQTPKAHHAHKTSPTPTYALGSVAWDTALQAQLSRQWGTQAPPLWVAPDPRRKHTWFLVAPLAHHGRLWWSFATPKHPMPTFESVSTTLDLTNAQLAALPAPMQGALNQAYDLMHDQPWPLTVSMPALQSNGSMTATQAEARGTTHAPIGWSINWTPAQSAGSGQAAVPAGMNVIVTLPWAATGYSPVLANESMEWLTTGHLVSGGDVAISMNGTTMQPLPATDTSILVPSSVKAGISGPTLP